MNLEGKKAIVTGGSRGIGFAIARKLIECGAKVVITGRHAETLEQAAEKLGGKDIYPLVWDTADLSVLNDRLNEAVGLLGGLDILVNNAGIHTEEDFSGMMSVTPAGWDMTQNVNVRGVFFLTQAAARYWMDAHQGGRVVNICSNTAYRALANAYGVSKWAVRGMTEGMGKALAPYGIFVNGIAPGPTSTSMLGRKEGETVANHTPLGRYSYPCEMADICAFLASDEAGSMVGQILVADGGETLR